MTTQMYNPDTSAQPASIEDRLEEARRRLLDLTRRNRLLNHRAKGRSTLRVVDESPTEVFRLLVSEGKTLQFLAREEAPKEAIGLVNAAAARDEAGQADTVSSEPNGNGFALAPIDTASEPAARHTDHNLQTTLTGDQLQTRLLHLARESASAREEQGCNILYLTLGMVEWREHDRGPTNRAPLLFVPADLQRKSVQSRHSLRLFEDDIVVNPSLIELCKRIFRFDLPSIEIHETPDVAAYFGAVGQVLSAMAGWRFVPEIHLGLFSFAKLLMYRDLDLANWPPTKRLSQHPLVRRLSGVDADVAGDEKAMPDATTLDETVQPSESFQILDADSSQQVAILAAKRGLSAVIEGPPGTGKSQTITNVIAECLAEGKTVLFVAEKAAALAVVKRRLEAAGLDDFVLELHSHKAHKRTVLDELQRTLAVYEQPITVRAPDPQTLEISRTRLNAYVRDLHTPLGVLAISPFEAIGRALALRDLPEVVVQIADPLSWSGAQLSAALDQLDAFDRWRARVGDPERHPWRGVGLTSYGTETRQRVQHHARALVDAIGDLARAVDGLATLLQRAPPETVVGVRAMLVDARSILESPQLAPGLIADRHWDERMDERSVWLNQGMERARHKAIWSHYVAPEAEKVDWGPLLVRRQHHHQTLLHRLIPSGLQDQILRRFSPSWQEDAQLLDRHLLPNVHPSVDQQLALLQALVASATLRTAVLKGVKQFATQFGSHWHNIDGDWDELRRIADAVGVVRQLVARRALGPDGARRVVEHADRTALAERIMAVEAALNHAEDTWSDWYAVIASDAQHWLRGEWQHLSFATLNERHMLLLDSIEQLEDWIQFQSVLAVCSAEPLHSLVAWALSPAGTAARGRLAQCFARQFYHLWIDEALRRTSLQSFRGEDHQVLVEQFRSADTRWIEASRRRVVGRVRARIPDLSHSAHKQSKLGILKAEMRKKRRHMPLRRLFATVGDVVQTIKPCFMMSPISIAQYLTPGLIEFDVVVFDEASQVEPADAYGAIARGHQLLLVGDEKQLPPTNFFNKIEVDDEQADPEGFAASDLESILSLGEVRLHHHCALRWHYRSRHASLIEFSNQKFYAGNLRVFPGPFASNSEFGLLHRYVEGGVYMRGAGQHNPVEARAVAQEVVRHAVDAPHLSLGVGAFSVAQQHAIEDEIERMRRVAVDPRVEAFFTAATHEPFFVKNLETIQGDERDVILLSVGYGPDEHGKLTMNFGPLNREGGWRRLNVLVTRARQRCVLFSSIRADQINLGATQARGVVALKEYLHLAEHGRLAGAAVPSGDHDSPFEAAVCRVLREHGWEVHAQVGSAGFFIDLAVVDREQPGRYLLGIECDGATYHSSPTARDRDRLRQQVLEDLGWTIHRIWSTDWFRRPDSTLKQILTRLEAVRRDRSATNNDRGDPTTSTERDDPDQMETRKSLQELLEESYTERDTVEQPLMAPGVQPYAQSELRTSKSRIPVAAVTPDILGSLIERVVRVETPIHVEEAQRVLASYFSSRASKGFQALFDAGLRYALSRRAVAGRGKFLWIAGAGTPVRYRGEDCPVTEPEFIAPEEFQAAVKVALARELGIKQDALIVSTARLIGFRRCGAKLEAAIAQAIQDLHNVGIVERDGEGFLILRQS